MLLEVSGVSRAALLFGTTWVVNAYVVGAILAWCRARGLGLEPAVVDELLGPDRVADQQRRARAERLRIAAALAAIALLLALGLAATDDPDERTLYGRTGEVRTR